MLAKTLLTAALCGSVFFITTNGQTPDEDKEPLKRLEIIIQPQKPPPEKPIINGEKCSDIVRGLQFCTTTPVVSTDSAKSVPVRLRIKNLSQSDVTIVHGDFYDYYATIIFDPNGKRLLSDSEEYEKKYKEGLVNQDEIVELPINSAPRDIILSPNQEYNVEFNLAQFYDFSTKGKYRVVLLRKITSKDNQDQFVVGFGRIEVEIK